MGLQRKNSDTEMPPGPGGAGKVTPAAGAVKWSRVREMHQVWAPRNKRPFHEDDALGILLLGEEGRNQREGKTCSGCVSADRVTLKAASPLSLDEWLLFMWIPLQKNIVI